MSKTGGRGTPDDLDYLFERDIIDEEDYVDFWASYWKRDEAGREELVNEYLNIAAIAEGEQGEGGTSLQLSGVVTQVKQTAIDQAASIGGYVVRRDKRGRFSKRGHYFQAIRRKRHDKTGTEEAT